jgi:hypothetical protein
MPILVNGQGQSLSSVNQDKSSNGPSEVTQLIEALLKNGADGNIGKNLAPVIGLPKPMPMKQQEIVMSERASDFERRACFVIYENIAGPAQDPDEKRPVCAYILKSKREGTNHQVRYFRIDLTGKLEKAILSRSKIDSNGKGVRGSGVKTDLDIESSEVKKNFEAEMKFWLKDWLKKQPKAPAKKA